MAGSDFSRKFDLVRKYSMTPVERLYDLYKAVHYVNSASVPGDIVEVGVWKGGALGMASLASSDHSLSRRFCGFDTFTGHLPPSEDETDLWGNNLYERWRAETENGRTGWAAISKNEVAKNFAQLGGNLEQLELIEGDIVKTVADWDYTREISILRIDVDWYPETKASLEGLFPSLAQGGVLICDDYGHHSGAKKAVDDFFSDKPIRLSHVDYSCVVAVKMG